MKVIISLFILISSIFAESNIQFKNKIIEDIAIQDSSRSFINFKIICINGYQFLYTVDSKGNGSSTQMFYTPKGQVKQIPQPIKCSGFEETRD